MGEYCNLCADRFTSLKNKSVIQGIPICGNCSKLEEKLIEILGTDKLEDYITFSELIVYCDMLRNDMAAEEKDIPFNEYLNIVRN